MSNDRAEAFELYCSNIASWPGNGMDFDELLEGFNDRYQGYFGGVMKDAKTEFTYQYIEDTGALSRVPEIIGRYSIMKPSVETFFWKVIPNMMVISF